MVPSEPPAGREYLFGVNYLPGQGPPGSNSAGIAPVKRSNSNPIEGFISLPGSHEKRQEVGFVVGAIIPGNCSLASPFVFANGTLSSGGEYVSTEPGVAYQPFWTLPTTASIDTTFGIIGDELIWYNPAFHNGIASFCLDLTGHVWVIFDGHLPQFPCYLVELLVFCSKSSTFLPPISSMSADMVGHVACECDDGVIVPEPPYPDFTGTITGIAGPTGTGVATTGGSTGTGAPGSTGTGISMPTGTKSAGCTGDYCQNANSTLVLPPNTYFASSTSAVPGEYCVTRNESWVLGQTTLLPHHPA